MIEKGVLEKRVGIPVGMKIWINGNVRQVGPNDNIWLTVQQLIASIAACDSIMSLHGEAAEHMRHLLDMNVDITDTVKKEPVPAMHGEVAERMRQEEELENHALEELENYSLGDSSDG